MQAGEIAKPLRARPFESFRLRMSDGSSVIVRHADQALVTARRIFIGHPAQRADLESETLPTDEPAEDWIVLDPST